MKTEAELVEISYRDLQALCKQRGLQSSGKKAELISRIVGLQFEQQSTQFNQTRKSVSLSKVSSLPEFERRKLRQERFGNPTTIASAAL